jgi:predicted metal-binding protein
MRYIREYAMTPQERDAFLQILSAHERTVAVCRACAETTRDLAAEVKRGGVPARDQLAATITEAETVLDDLRAVSAEVQRLKAALRC